MPKHGKQAYYEADDIDQMIAFLEDVSREEKTMANQTNCPICDRPVFGGAKGIATHRKNQHSKIIKYKKAPANPIKRSTRDLLSASNVMEIRDGRGNQRCPKCDKSVFGGNKGMRTHIRNNH